MRPARQGDPRPSGAIHSAAGVAPPASWALEPVTLEDRQAWFSRLTAADFPVLVLQTPDGAVAGFASYGPFRPLAGWAPTVEHSIYIGEGHRASGGGRMLMNALIDYASGRGVHVMVGVIDADNEESIAFHRRLGFEETGRMPQVGRKFGRWLDAVFMTRVFDGPDPD